MAESAGVEPAQPFGLVALAPRCLAARPTLRSPRQDSVVRALTSESLVADVVVALAAVETAGAQAAFFESAVPSCTDTDRCARASRSALYRRARRDRRAAPASPRDNPASACATVRKDGSRSKSSRRMVASSGSTLGKSGQGGRIRTCDLLVPSQERCRAALRPEIWTIQQDSNLRPPGPQPGALVH